MIDVDTKGQTTDELEGFARIPSGWYDATVTSLSNRQKDGALEVHWKISNPPWTGTIITDIFNLPSLAMKREQVPKLVRRLSLFLYRMGLITKEQMGQRLSVDERALIGMRRILQVKREAKQDAPPGSPEYSNIVYGAYYTLDRAEIPPEDRIRLGLALLPGQKLPVPAAAGTTPDDRLPSNGVVSPTGSATPFDPSEV